MHHLCGSWVTSDEKGANNEHSHDSDEISREIKLNTLIICYVADALMETFTFGQLGFWVFDLIIENTVLDDELND